MTADEARKLAQTIEPEQETKRYLDAIVAAAKLGKRIEGFKVMPIEVQVDLMRLGYKLDHVIPSKFPFVVEW
jgi:hypothetical protein